MGDHRGFFKPTMGIFNDIDLHGFLGVSVSVGILQVPIFTAILTQALRWRVVSVVAASSWKFVHHRGDIRELPSGDDSWLF